jgi:predicted RNA-binding Zn-ribbon protein involved in translation (DUF1610 family)
MELALAVTAVTLSGIVLISTLVAAATAKLSKPYWAIPPFTSTTTSTCWSVAMSSGPTIPAVWAMRKPESHMVYFDCPHCGKTHFLDTRSEIYSDGSASVHCKERDSDKVVQNVIVINHIQHIPRKR